MGSQALLADRYELNRLIGQGRRKRVYHAHDSRLDRDVALARFDAAHIRINTRNVIQWEAQLMSRLGHHPNIVTVYDAHWEGNDTYLVTEYMREGELQEYCQRIWDAGGKVPLDQGIRIADEICQALAHVHDSGFIHCDVAPSNVWLDEAKRACLGDFDSAVPLSDPIPIKGETDETTASFQAPEHAAGLAVDQRSDLYSLGGVLHYLLTKRPPRPKPRLRELEAAAPQPLVELLRRLLARDPRARPESALAVHGALEALRVEQPAQTVRALVALGEGAQTEFKSSMFAVCEPKPEIPHQDQQRALPREVVKTVAAFMNTSGGALLIGVRDDGEVLGIEPDIAELGKDATRDKWELRLKNRLKSDVGADALHCVRISYELCNARTVALLTVSPRSKETWVVDGGKEAFFVRLANSSEQLTGSALVSYVREHWPA